MHNCSADEIFFAVRKITHPTMFVFEHFPYLEFCLMDKLASGNLTSKYVFRLELGLISL
jgi:hypothetical protein